MRRRVASSVLLTSLSQSATMVLGGVLAILVAATFGSNARTDGFFAAYGLYAVLVLLAQSARITIVPRLVDSPTRFGTFDEFFATMVLAFIVCGVAFVALGDPLASVLTGSLPSQAQSTARTALLILWPAAGCHLVAALSAAMLGVLGDYTRPALSYAGGSATSILAFLLMKGAFGIDALPVAILIGAFITVLPLLSALVGWDWRPSPALKSVSGSARRLALMAASSLPFMLLQIMYLVSVTVASHIGTGEITVFSYAFFALGVAIAFLSSSVSMVLAAPLSVTWDRNPASLGQHIDDVFRTGLVVLVPAIALAAFVGEDIGRALLSGFTNDQVEHAVVSFLVMSAGVVAAQVPAIPLIALFTLGRHGLVSLLAVPVVIVQGTIAIFAGAAGSLYLLAASVPAGLAVLAVGVLVLLYGRRWANVGLRLVGDVLRVALPGAGCFALSALVSSGLSPTAAHVVGFVLGVLLYASVVVFLMPEHWRLAVRLLQSLRGSPQADSL